MEREVICRHLQGVCQAQAELMEAEGKPAPCHSSNSTCVGLASGPPGTTARTTRLSPHFWIEQPIALRPQPEYMHAPESERHLSQRPSEPQQKPAVPMAALGTTAAPPHDYRIPRRRPHAFHTLGISRPSATELAPVSAG